MTLSILKWVVIIVIVAVLAFVVGRGIGSDDENSLEPTLTPVYERVTATPVPVVSRKQYRVEFRDGVIAPSALTVRVGDTVTFYNASMTSFWPAGDASAGCSSLDAKRVLRNGESYTVTMNTRGTCSYHDASDVGATARRGTITVQ